jgi:DNA-binding NtrC family response regulator
VADTDDSTLTDEAGAELDRLASRLELVWFAPRRQTLPLTGERPLSCGRDASCDVQLQASSSSREHAHIEKDGPIWIVRDLGSKNGVWVDGQRVERALLEAGTVLRVGDGVAVVAPEAGEAAGELSELAPGLWGGVKMAAVAKQARLAARSSLHVVLEAESGAGKECFAKAIYAWSEQSGALVALNCAALPPNLAEAELFGYVRGAFTGADRTHDGYFRAAADGTLFLDELLELPLGLQAKLLRAVEERAVTPLGGTRPLAANVRIIAASQQSLRQASEAGRLRPDLLARLNGVTIEIPPLRQRREDIFPLFQHFLRRAGVAGSVHLSAPALEALCVYDWPLNVRELEAVAQRFCILHPGEQSLDAKQVAGLIGRPLSELGRTAPKAADDSIWKRLVAALASEHGNVLRAAERLGISRARAYRLLAQHPDFDVDSVRRS